ncbi:Sodium, potassium, lithium and rubidium/H(+) antiporter [Nonomuraea coxensis DSM 45129]|uniref:Sodium, potassium, lithium and rubidium/H(+) antiporter n=1 Tax=Nonomuraea coxensis DSM 45129 TaxID=1122611 RepID=A0ABX8U9Y1_9ACTN|nr:Na+/H+ antiporter [Nonomuraea coxensis]QYC43467.1 Sodium, potassium, lithium and rubidium/H(+) antiporter [Nonomuraea coxensis DSM 45129]
MSPILGLQLLLVAGGAIAVAAVARRKGWPAPLLLVAAGLLASPLVPAVPLDPELVLYVFLPPLLYSAALDSSYLRLRDARRAVGLLSIGLVLFTAAVVGFVVHLLLPGLPLPLAFALGAIIAPPDAVAAVAVGRRLGLPRRTLTLLIGESLFNDATALTAYRVAIGAFLGGTVELLHSVGAFVLAAAGGVAIGLGLALVFAWLFTLTRDSLVENTLTLLIPFAAYLAAESVHASGVIAVVIVGLHLGSRMHLRGFGTRLVSDAVWKVTAFFLETIVFALIGLQLVTVIRGISGYGPWEVAGYAAAVLAATILTRFVWVFAASFLLKVVRRGGPQAPGRQQSVLLGWAGMRGVVSLAAAFAIPPEVPPRERAMLLFLTFTTVIGTLLIQGTTFPALIRRLGVSSEQERYEDRLAEAAAQQAALEAGLAELDRLVAEQGHEPDEIQKQVIDQLREKSWRRSLTAWERLGGGTGPGGSETPSALYRRLRRAMLQAERQVFVRLRDERRLDDEVLREVMAQLDFEEAILER